MKGLFRLVNFVLRHIIIGKNKMAAPSSGTFNQLSGVLDYLVGIYTLAKEKKEFESQVIQQCKELLKPWPKKKKSTETGKNDKARDDKKEDVKEKKKDKIETQMLNEVEEMLTKAQAARDVLAKAVQPKNKKCVGKSQDTPPNARQKESNDKQDRKNRVQSAAHETSQTGVISQSDLTKLISDTSTISLSGIHKKGTSEKKERKVTVKEGAKKAAITQTKQSKSKPLVKIPPVTRKQYSTSASEIGRYSKRPSSKVTSSYSQKALSASANERKKIGSANANRQHPTVKSANERTRNSASKRQHSTRGNRTAQNVQILARKMLKSNASSSQNHTDDVRSTDVDDVSSTKTDATNSISNDVTNTDIDDAKNPRLSDCRSKPHLKSDVKSENSAKNLTPQLSDKRGEVDETEEEEEVPFLLKTDGSKLKFPSHFRKTFNAHERLINKVLEVMSRSEQTPECQYFLDRVNTKLLRTNGGFSFYDHDLRYRRLEQEYEELIGKADQQLLSLAQISDESNWQDLYRIKVTMEAIHNRSQQLLTEIKDFEQQEAKYCEITEAMKLKTAVKNDTSSKLPSTFFLSPDNQDVLDDIYPQSILPVRIEYSKLNELQRLVGLQLELQILEVEEQTQKLLAAEFLPLLSEMDKNDPRFVQCYRLTYGLLCHRGEQFPTMIVDDIGETESTCDDDDDGY
ncbi:uncharacterized protein [Antedon mediterranea]|uniref:uncharacterized protein n=1 Tax=Antedon mediterranea TaxID=105859 RepID=UPI003AF8D0D9